MSLPALFQPLTVREMTVRNRVWMPPMCMYSCMAEDGIATQWHRIHYGARAIGGAGLIIVEATAVTPDGRISPRDLGLWNDEQRDALTPLTEFVRAQGAAIGIQLAHAGRKGSCFPAWGVGDRRGTVPPDQGGWHTLSASSLAFEGYSAPREMTTLEIAEVIEHWGEAARRSIEAGFDFVEVHGAHGYLIHQFLSPLSNRRTDEYGGTLENRARLLLEVVRRVRAEVGNRPVFVRLSATDWMPGGWTPEETAIVAEWSRDAGADLIDVSSGGLVAAANIPLSPGYQVPFSRTVREGASMPTAAVGLITDATQANEIIERGDADAVLVGREMLRDPQFALRAARELAADIDYWPGQYLRAR
jgi:2,4-dienoyl-CoA reductase-like NADH-dependent reductase (Old Yellow Enzyme family)